MAKGSKKISFYGELSPPELIATTMLLLFGGAFALYGFANLMK